MSIRNYSNTAPPRTLYTGVGAVASNTAGQSLVVSSTITGYPAPPFLLGLERGSTNQEVCLCTAVSGSTFTVTRGYDGTPAPIHLAGATIEHTSSAIDYTEANAFVNLLDSLVGGLIVGTSGNAVAVPAATVLAQGGLGNVATGVALMIDGSQAAGVSWQQVIAPGITAHTAATNPPPGWIQRDGSFPLRSLYPNLFTAIGTTYNLSSDSGDTTHFRLPNALGRFDLGAGTGPGSITYTLGSLNGNYQQTIDITNMPSHNHGFPSSGILNTSTPGNPYFNSNQGGAGQYNFQSITGMITSNTGGGTPLNIMPSYQALTPIIKF